MHNRHFVFAVILLAFVACRQDKEGDQSQLKEKITKMASADAGIPPDSLLAMASALPAPWQDSFFIQRLAYFDDLENDSGIKTTLSAYKKARPGNLLPLSLEQYYFGIFNQYAAKFDSAEWYYNRAISGFEQIPSAYFLARGLEKYAGNKIIKGNTEDAIIVYNRIFSLYDSLGLRNDRMTAQMHLANCYNLKGDFDKVIALLKEPLAYFEAKKDSSSLAFMMAMQGTALISKKDFANALVVHKSALAIRQKIKDPTGTTESLYHVGRALNKLERWQEALDTLRVAEKRLISNSDKQGAAHIQAAIGEALFGLGQYNEAEQYLLNSLEMSTKRRQYPAAALAARRMSTVRASQKRFAEALQYHEDFMSYKDSVFNQERTKLSKELTAKYEAREKELQIATLQNEKKLAVQRNWWIAGSFFLILLAGFYQLRLYTTRERLRVEAEKAQKEAETQRLAKELEIQSLELANHRARLDDFAQMLIDRNRHLQEFTPGSPNLPTNMAQVNPESSEVLFNQVILTESDWEKFQAYFNKVYPGFISRLRAQFSDLTPGEIRLVLLDKMGLSLKESAAILGISIDAVKKGRYRLKKKYDLNTDDLSVMFETV